MLNFSLCHVEHLVEGIVFNFLSQYFVNVFSSYRGKIVMSNRDHKERVKPVSPYKNDLICYNCNLSVQEHIGTQRSVN